MLTPVNIAALGIVDGCTDMYTQVKGYPHQAYNNTYGLQLISKDDYDYAIANITEPDGLFSLTAECRRLEQQLDPQQFGNVDAVNQACHTADSFAIANVLSSYLKSGVSFD
jgi:carboxypeptidase D